MKHYFMCSLCHNGVLGGVLIVDEQSVNYKTGKVTVERKYRDIVLKRDDILSISWKWAIFPKATFTMKNGEKYSFLIINKSRFMKIYES